MPRAVLTDFGEHAPFFGALPVVSALAADASNVYVPAGGGTIADIAAARFLHSDGVGTWPSVNRYGFSSRAAAAGLFTFDHSLAASTSFPACAVLAFASLETASANSYFAIMRAGVTSLMTLLCPTNGTLRVAIRNSSGGDAVGPVTLTSSAPYVGVVGYRVLPNGTGSQIYVNGEVVAQASSSFTPAGASNFTCSNSTPRGIVVLAAAVWPRTDIGVARMAALTTDYRRLFSEQAQFMSFWASGGAGYAPTLSDLRAVNVTGSSTQWSLDYTF